MLTGQFAQWSNFPPGIAAGLALGLCLVPAFARRMLSGASPSSDQIARTLAGLYLAAGGVLVGAMLNQYLGSALPAAFPLDTQVNYPFTLWQMETILLLLAGIVWLGKAISDQAMRRQETVILLCVYLIYLGLRLVRFVLDAR